MKSQIPFGEVSGNYPCPGRVRQTGVGLTPKTTVKGGLERGTQFQSCAYIGTAEQGAEIKAHTHQVQAEAGGKLSFFCNTIVVIVAGQVITNTGTKLSITPSIELCAEGKPLGIIFETKGFLFGQVNFGGNHVVGALVGDADGCHRAYLEGALIFQ